MSDWMPGAKRHSGDWGSSNPYIGKTPKVVWHTTESDAGSTSGNLNWASSQGYGPHLWWDPYTGELTQSLPVSTPATAVADPNGKGLNRAGSVVVQVEVIGRAKNAPLATSPLKGKEQVMAWLRSLGVPDRFPAGVPTGMSGDRSVYGVGSPAGHYTHSQMPDNSHVDPGRIDEALLFGAVNNEEQEMDEFIEGTNAAQAAFLKDGKIGDPPTGKGKFYRAGWNDVRWQVNNLKGKDGAPGPKGDKGDPGVAGPPGASHSHERVSVSGPPIMTP